MASTAKAEQLLATLKNTYQINNEQITQQQLKDAAELLKQLKLELIHFTLTPPFNEQQLPNIKKQLLIAREVYEYVCFHSLASNAIPSFVRAYAQLRVFYVDFASLLPASERRPTIVALYLLYLLSYNEITSFHMEYELLLHENKGSSSISVDSFSSVVGPIVPPSPTAHSSPSLLTSSALKFPIMLEQQLIEGSYEQILSYAHSAQYPSWLYGRFMSILVDTVRVKIADCAEVAYVSLPLNSAQQMLHLETADKLKEFVAKREHWSIKDNTLLFNMEKKREKHDATSIKTIKQILDYATELEQIV